jgi:hypothetical protein
MGAIEKLIKKFSVQDAVYWGNPQPDGFTGITFDAPIDFKCRWEQRPEFKMLESGQIETSSSKILTNLEADIQGFVWLGTVAELTALAALDTTIDISDPKTVPDAFVIRQKDKIPMVRKTDDFVRIYYLFDYGK